MPVPERIAWTVALLDPQPADRILEIGCGPGVAADLVASSLHTGRFVGLDRSTTAIGRALQRNAAHVTAGRAAFETLTLADAGGLGSFDKVFSINVNVFWTSPARAELAAIRSLLAPGGSFFACWDGGPGPGRSAEIAAKASAAFEASGFVPEVIGGGPAAVGGVRGPLCVRTTVG